VIGEIGFDTLVDPGAASLRAPKTQQFTDRQFHWLLGLSLAACFLQTLITSLRI
jgi:hypothetical protein